MATSIDFGKSSDQTAMERFGGGGMTLLPWTKQILGVLWEQLRLLIQIIYYSFVSVFQMFRFEVHVRITDEIGQHVQHMTTAANSTESLLFSSLFDGDNGVMVGGTTQLSAFCSDVVDSFPGSSTTEALLSSLRADDLCCGLVDDFVSRTKGKDDSIFLGHHPSWKMGFPADWNIFLSSTDNTDKRDTCHKSTEKIFEFKHDISEEEKSSQWSSEEDQSMGDFDNEESRALWESLSKSNDPYNPFFFTASTSTYSGKTKVKVSDTCTSECISPSKADDDLSGPQSRSFWSSRSDSESSWGSSEGSWDDLDNEESEKLWDLFSSSLDPYNPMCFTACTVSMAPQSTRTLSSSQKTSHSPADSKSDTDTEEKESSFTSPSSDEEEEDQLWKSICQIDDPYHPLNFQACQQTSCTSATPSKPHPKGDPNTPHVQPPSTPCSQGKSRAEEAKNSKTFKAIKPILKEKKLKHHHHPDTILVPWKRASQTPATENEDSKTSTREKTVQFSPFVKVHTMRTWLFARQASRKGQWEQMARDRVRFLRRVQETEQAIGYCFSQSHREKMWAHLHNTPRSATPSCP